ncbi:cytidine deaminase [Lachnospiraceae bacterium XBB2008]|nr:cytidine deaminase [Lachnospiraceae bacterium XBB2008]
MIEESMIHKLISLADEARSRSYAPYSNYAVGAALLCEDGTIVTGCNMENAAFGPGICAERCAIYKAVSDGRRSFRAIAVAGSPVGEKISQYASPCGVCRQVMREFADPKSFDIIVAGPDSEYRINTLDELLPDSFGPDNLS